MPRVRTKTGTRFRLKPRSGPVPATPHGPAHAGGVASPRAALHPPLPGDTGCDARRTHRHGGNPETGGVAMATPGLPNMAAAHDLPTPGLMVTTSDPAAGAFLCVFFFSFLVLFKFFFVCFLRFFLFCFVFIN